ncbi:MAG: hypothetical protein QM669_00050 [Siphonobacter sp.]
MKQTLYFATFMVVLHVMTSCSSKMTFGTSVTVPSASGTVTFKTDKNKNYIMDVNVRNLAPPKNLTPSKNTYLVWMESDEKGLQKLGQLLPSGKMLKGNLKATSVEKPKLVFITAEDYVDALTPEGTVILTTRK